MQEVPLHKNSILCHVLVVTVTKWLVKFWAKKIRTLVSLKPNLLFHFSFLLTRNLAYKRPKLAEDNQLKWQKRDKHHLKKLNDNKFRNLVGCMNTDTQWEEDCSLDVVTKTCFIFKSASSKETFHVSPWP